MFERFTTEAHGTVERARGEAVRMHHSFIGTEHILLALLEAEEDDGVLHGLGVDMDRTGSEIISALESLITPKSD